MAIIRVTQSDEVIAIGKTGENAATTVFFNISAWMQEYGTGGTAVLLHQRKGDESPYPCDTELENGVVKWEVTSADVAAAGRGLCELQYVVDDTVVKSRIWTTETAASMDDAGEAPDPEDGWIASLLAEIAELTEAVPVVTITQTSSGAKVTVTDASGTTTATIYNGTDGADGEDGEDGNGIASLVQTTSSTASGGANVWTATMDDGTTSSLTVYNGAQGETGADGADGATGADGAAGADGNGIASLVQTTSSTESGGENVWTCTMDDGTTSTLTVCNGAQGEQGETGKGLTILGYYDTLAALTAAVTGPEDGDVYAVGTEAPYEIYVYTSANGWVDNGQLQGAAGADGEDGEDGVGIASLTQTTSSTASGGANVWTATLTDGTTSTLTVYNGAAGAAGEDGEDGAAATITIGTVTTGAAGSSASVTNSGTTTAAVFNFTIPQGAQGDTGEDGADGNGIASLVQTTSSTASGGANVWTATMTDGTTSSFTVYNGAQGETGATGATGADGADGADGVGIASLVQTTSSTASSGANVWTATLTDGTTSSFTVYNGAQGESAGSDGTTAVSATIEIGTVTTGEAGTDASVTNSGTTTAAVFDFVIPRGADGEDGEDGADGADGADGKSAYEYAVDGGYTGAETEFATLLATIVTLIDAEEASY